MKAYINPEIEVVELDSKDVITTSAGIETSPYEERGGIWSFR